MNQYSAIREVRRLLRAVMEQSQRPELIEQLEEIDVRLKAFHEDVYKRQELSMTF